MKIKFAENCAWRGIYIYSQFQNKLHGDKLVARLVVDPNNGVKPIMDVKLFSWESRITLPWIPWKSNASPIHRKLYQLSSGFWHGVDGRYGWGKRQ